MSGPDPGSPAYEAARKVLVAELARIGAEDARNGMTRLADAVARGKAADVPSYVTMQLLARAEPTPDNAPSMEGER